MSKSTTTPSIVTADMVRAFYRDEKAGAARVERFGLGDDKSIKPGARGRLSPAAIAGYNKGKPVARHYVSGATKAAASAQVAAAKALRAKAAESGVTVGKRGPLSKAALSAAGVKPARKTRKG